MSAAYEIAVARDEAEELADKLMAALPGMALPGAQIGVVIAALAFVIRRLIATRPADEHAELRDGIAGIIKAGALR